MNLGDLRHLFAYSFWASKQLLSAAAKLPQEQWIQDLGSSFPSLQETFAHLVGAEWVWLLRWRQQSPKGPPEWKHAPSAEVLLRVLQEVQEERQRFLDQLQEDDLTRVVHFTFLSGESGAQPLGQLMLHLVNHSTYHRGQITTMMRQLGSSPPTTDLYVFNALLASAPQPRAFFSARL